MKVLLQSRSDRQSHGFRVTSHPLAEAVARDFGCGQQAGTLALLDAVLPHCVRMVEFGAYIGLTALYAATWCAEICAFEPSPTNYELLACTIAANPKLAPRIRLFRHGIGQADSYVPLYAKGTADPGASVFREVERKGTVCARQDAIVPLRDAGAVLREIGLDGRTLLNIDIAGAEYAVLPRMADLLAKRKPWLLGGVPSVQPGGGQRRLPHGAAAAALFHAGRRGAGHVPLRARLRAGCGMVYRRTGRAHGFPAPVPAQRQARGGDCVTAVRLRTHTRLLRSAAAAG